MQIKRLPHARHWHMSGVTRDRRSLRIEDTHGELVALVPLRDESEDAREAAEERAKLISTAANLKELAESILRWDERQDRERRLPRSLERKLIATLAKVEGHV